VEEFPPRNLIVVVESCSTGGVCRRGSWREERESGTRDGSGLDGVGASNFIVVVMIHASRAHPLGTSARTTRIREQWQMGVKVNKPFPTISSVGQNRV
jgi:hypothetical protein